jgi:hypothetical protein
LAQGKFRAEINCHLGCSFLSDILHFEGLATIFNILDVASGRFEVLAAALARNFESKDLGLVVVNLRWQNHGHRVVHLKHRRETGSEAGPIDIDLSGLRQVDFLATGAEVFESAGLQ